MEDSDERLRQAEELRLENDRLREELADKERLRDELARHKALARALLEVSTDSICLLDPAGTVLEINEPAARRAGCKPEDAIGRNIFDLTPEELRENRRRWLHEAVETRRTVQFKDVWRGNSFGHRFFPYHDQGTGAVRVAVFSRDVSATDKALKALRESEARYRAMVELQEEAVCRWLPDTTLTYVNQGYCRLVGMKPEEVLGRSLLEHIPAHARSEVEAYIHTLIRDPRTASIENETIDATGQVRWLEWSDSPILNDRGLVVEFQSVGRDITDRKAAEQALQEGEARYRGIVEDQTELICRYLPDGRLSYVNEAYARYFGKDRSELMDRNYIPHIPDDDLRLIKEHIDSLTPLNPVTAFEHRVFMPGSGEVRWQRWTHRALHDAKGHLTEYQAVGRDITQRKLAEQEISDSRAFLRQIIDTVPNPIFVKDHEGMFLLVNKAMANLYGSTPEELVGRKGGDFNPDSYEVALFRAEDLHVLDTEEPVFIPQRTITHASGERRWYATTKLPIRDKSQILGVAVDITDRIEAEAERSRLEKHFRQAQKLQALGTLAGGIAHDFNNMIFAILGFVRLALKAAPEDGKVRGYLEQIQSAGMRASQLVRQILTFSRRTEQEKKTVRVSELLQEITGMLRATIGSNIEIVTTADTDDDAIVGDPIQIHQVLMNLSTNAAHAMGERGGRLTIALGHVEVAQDRTLAHPDLAPGSYLEIAVSDTGHGIDLQTLEQIFDPFFTTKKPGEGTGMGLSVAHGIVKNHGGAILVESQVGKGSTFRVLLPKAGHAGPADALACEQAMGGTEKILFVDDELVLVRMVEEMLAGLGYRVTAFTDPVQALESFKEAPGGFDLVITDQAMPRLTGLDLAEAVLQARRDIPVLMLTGYTESVTEETAARMGVRECLMKPVVEEQLARAIRRALDPSE